jgi:hypothetical protein
MVADYLKPLRAQFNDRVRLQQKRPGVMQLFAPLYHEDGDMVDIFLEPAPESPDRVRVCDHGMTLMRLSYAYEIDTPTKEKIFNRLIAEQGVREANGNLFIDAPQDEIAPTVLQFAQTVAKVGAMRAFKREVIGSLFFEQLEEVVQTRLFRFEPQPSFYPLPDQEEYEVDYCFNHRSRPVYLFGVNSEAKARLTTIACLKFITEGLRFWSAVVVDNLDDLSRKDRNRLLSAADKVFPSLDDLRDNGETFLEREAESSQA